MKEKKSFSPLIIVASIVVLGSLAIFLFLSFLSNRKDDEKNQEGEASQEANLEGEKEREKYPILKNLPIKNAVYTIGYQFESDGTPTIIILPLNTTSLSPWTNSNLLVTLLLIASK